MKCYECPYYHWESEAGDYGYCDKLKRRVESDDSCEEIP